LGGGGTVGLVNGKKNRGMQTLQSRGSPERMRDEVKPKKIAIYRHLERQGVNAACTNN